MKKTMHFGSLILLLISLIITGCKQEEIKTDPQKLILGKWEIIQKGNWPDIETTIATGYTEYCQDSVIRFFDYKSNQFISSSTYWLNDSIVFIGEKREDGVNLITEYKYEFLNNNQNIRFDIQAFAIFNTFIYKRIE